MRLLRHLFGRIKPEPVPPDVVELRQAVTAARLARRIVVNRRPTGNKLGDALAGYERPSEDRRAFVD